MSERPRYKFKEALDEVFVDEYSNFYPDVLDSWPDSSEQESETGQHDGVEIADSFHNHIYASNSQPSIQ